MARTSIRHLVCAAAIGGIALLSACSTTVSGTPAASDEPAAGTTVGSSEPDSEVDQDAASDFKLTHPKRADESTSCKAALTPELATTAVGWQIEESGYSDDDLCFYNVTTPGDGLGTLSVTITGGVTGEKSELEGNTAFTKKDEFGCDVALTVAKEKDFDLPVALNVRLDAYSGNLTPDDACTAARKLVVAGFDNLPDA